MNLPTKLAYNPFFADKLAKFADEILLYGRNRLVFETRGGGGGRLSHPLVSTESSQVSKNQLLLSYKLLSYKAENVKILPRLWL